MEMENGNLKLVSNKAKRRISKWVFQENKARRIFRKTKILSFCLFTDELNYLKLTNEINTRLH